MRTIFLFFFFSRSLFRDQTKEIKSVNFRTPIVNNSYNKNDKYPETLRLFVECVCILYALKEKYLNDKRKINSIFCIKVLAKYLWSFVIFFYCLLFFNEWKKVAKKYCVKNMEIKGEKLRLKPVVNLRKWKKKKMMWKRVMLSVVVVVVVIVRKIHRYAFTYINIYLYLSICDI